MSIDHLRETTVRYCPYTPLLAHGKWSRSGKALLSHCPLSLYPRRSHTESYTEEICKYLILLIYIYLGIGKKRGIVPLLTIWRGGRSDSAAFSDGEGWTVTDNTYFGQKLQEWSFSAQQPPCVRVFLLCRMANMSKILLAGLLLCTLQGCSWYATQPYTWRSPMSVYSQPLTASLVPSVQPLYAPPVPSVPPLQIDPYPVLDPNWYGF